MQSARGVAHGARDRLRQLRSTRKQETAQQAARSAAEEKLAGEAPGMTKRLAAARDAAVQAVATAQEAISQALTAVADYDQAVRAASADLQSRGLRTDGGGEIGGRRDGGPHLSGEAWLPADAGALLAGVLADGVGEQAGPRHPVATWRPLGGLVAAAGVAELRERVGDRKTGRAS